MVAVIITSRLVSGSRVSWQRKRVVRTERTASHWLGRLDWGSARWAEQVNVTVSYEQVNTLNDMAGMPQDRENLNGIIWGE